MAVSQQWFVQWSTPSMIFADISRRYNNVNPNWNYEQKYRSPYENPSTVNGEYFYDDKSKYFGRKLKENFDHDLEKPKINGK